MDGYLFSIGTAFIVFPFVALLFTVPYILHQYRKYGSILFFKTAIVYSFILCLLTMYFLIILPLPPISKVEKMTGPTTQLIPFTFVKDFFVKSGFVWNDISTYMRAIKSSSFYNVFFNAILFMPFGIYLRYYFRCKKGKVVLFSFLLSLFFELTQLSALYGIYPKPYRLFDIDDLMVNTLGGFLGYAVTPLLVFLLPTRDELEKEAYEKGSKVSYFRRFVAFGIDNIVLLIASFCIPFYEGIAKYVLLVSLYFIILPYFTKGRTFGKWMVKIQMVSNDGGNIQLYQCLIRNGILYLLLLPTPLYVLSVFAHLNRASFITIVVLGILLMAYTVYIFQSFFRIITRKNTLFYEEYSKTKQISTIFVKQKETQE